MLAVETIRPFDVDALVLDIVASVPDLAPVIEIVGDVAPPSTVRPSEVIVPVTSTPVAVVAIFGEPL